MPKPKNNDYFENKNYNYCITQWRKFTTLTMQEEHNLKEMAQYQKRMQQKEKVNYTPITQRYRTYDKTKVFCRETQVIYKNIGACAKAHNTTTGKIRWAILRNKDINGFHFKELEE